MLSLRLTSRAAVETSPPGDAGRHLTGLRLRGCLETASGVPRSHSVCAAPAAATTAVPAAAARERFHCRIAVS